jgi:antitoxin (DNA-binding transcriptional repressor) of toxin-antitoxin stability system
MERLGAIEIHTHFGEVLDRVEHGAKVAVIREGRHVATIIPAQAAATNSNEAVRRLVARRETIQSEGRGLSPAEILSDRNEGRR